MTQFTLNLETIDLSEKQVFQLCQNNRDLRFERNSNGDLVIMSPAGGKTGHRNLEISYQLQAWSGQNQGGIAFDSSTGFKVFERDRAQ
jgi:Uma2 family endonuclease